MENREKIANKINDKWNIWVWIFGEKPTKFVDNSSAVNKVTIMKGDIIIASHNPHRFNKNKPILETKQNIDRIIIQ